MLVWLFVRLKLGLVTPTMITEVTLNYFAELEWRSPVALMARRRRLRQEA